jgi:predicted glycosyltransferase
MEKFLNHVETLFQLFSLFSDRVEGVSVVKLITIKGHGGVYGLLELYGIVPNFVTKAEAKVLYNRILLSQVRTSISFTIGFIDFLSFALK